MAFMMPVAAQAQELVAASPASIALQGEQLVFNSANLPANAGLSSSDELFASYVKQEFGVHDKNRVTLLALKTTRGSLLVGQEKVVYDKLSQRICDVAAGRESSTVIDIPLSDLGVKKAYTAEELGLESVFDADNPSEVSETARQAVNGMFNVALLRVLNAVLSDYPYELYWYDKTLGIAFEPPAISALDNGEGGALLFGKPYQAKFKMCVSADYSKDGLLQSFVADTAKTGAASSAAARAQAIVAENQGEGDYQKLYNYMQAVAKLTDYDYNAADRYDMTGIYGDPWQVIHVFDGDPGTKVVCEGYAKAFQYLCDLSEFSDDGLACNSVSGLMSGGTGWGAHMWNIVAMGGKNYLVDVTNNDNFLADDHESITPNDELFMAGASGDMYEGYRIEWGGEDGTDAHWMTYGYDEDLLHFFSEEELTLSQRSYLEDQAAEQQGGSSDADDSEPGKQNEQGGPGEQGATDGGNTGTQGSSADSTKPGASSTPSKTSQGSSSSSKAKRVTNITVNLKNVTAKVIKKALGKNKKTVTSITFGPRVVRIAKQALKPATKVKKIVLKTSRLKPKTVRGCLKGSKVKTVKVSVSKKVSKTVKKAYRKTFVKRIVGKRVTVN